MCLRKRTMCEDWTNGKMHAQFITDTNSIIVLQGILALQEHHVCQNTWQWTSNSLTFKLIKCYCHETILLIIATDLIIQLKTILTLFCKYPLTIMWAITSMMSGTVESMLAVIWSQMIDSLRIKYLNFFFSYVPDCHWLMDFVPRSRN